MRLVPINCVREGTYLAKSIYDSKGKVLLRKNYQLTMSVLKKIEQNGIMSLYINDKYSSNEIEDFIKPELRIKAIQTVKDSYEGIDKFINRSNGRDQYSKGGMYSYIDNIVHIAEDIIDEIISSRKILINLVDIKSMDNYTYEHCINVTVLSIVIGIELELDKKKLRELAVGALLHDIGKVFVPKEILNKNDKLTDNEFIKIKEHPVNGFMYVKDNAAISMLSGNIVLHHHERVDGTGYPDGIGGDKIHKLVKIVSTADVYDALTSDRPYRKAMSPNEAMEYLMGAVGRYFDYNIVNAFLKKVIPYPVGTLVKLSTGDVAVIEEINSEYPLRPKVKVFTDVHSNIGIQMDLMKENSIVIEGIQYETA